MEDAATVLVGYADGDLSPLERTFSALYRMRRIVRGVVARARQSTFPRGEEAILTGWVTEEVMRQSGRRP